jgi:uncharacterized membrane-anchored protein
MLTEKHLECLEEAISTFVEMGSENEKLSPILDEVLEFVKNAQQADT